MKISDKKPLLVLTGIFLLSRALFYLAGVRFDASSMDCFFQILDPELLRHDLLRSILYLHSQPPLFNLGIGLVLKLFPGNEVAAFSIIGMALGVVLLWSMFGVMRQLGAGRLTALIVSTVFIIGPQSILYENWLYYTYATAALVSLSAYLLYRYIHHERLRDGVLFFLTVALVILTRSLFHLVWMIATIALVSLMRRDLLKTTLTAAALPLLLVLSLYIKNTVITGSFTTSTWLGMNLSRKTTFLMPEETRRAEIARGELSPLALIGSFNGLTAYDSLPYQHAATGIPALDQVWKAYHCPNLNNIAYVDISRGYLNDAMHVITTHPGIYVKGCALGLFTFTLPSSNIYYLQQNRQQIPVYERLYNLAVFGQLLSFDSAPLDDASEGYLGKKLLVRGWFIIAGLPLLFWYGWRRARRGIPKASPNTAFSVTLYFMLGTIAYVSIVGNAVEIMENNRFRFIIEPFIAVLAALAFSSLWEWFHVRRGIGPSIETIAPGKKR